MRFVYFKQDLQCYSYKLTESTDAISATITMMIEVLKRNIGVPHCKGYGILIQAAVCHASDTSVLQCFMVYACFLQASIKIFELGMLDIQPL